MFTKFQDRMYLHNRVISRTNHLFVTWVGVLFMDLSKFEISKNWLCAGFWLWIRQHRVQNVFAIKLHWHDSELSLNSIPFRGYSGTLPKSVGHHCISYWDECVLLHVCYTHFDRMNWKQNMKWWWIFEAWLNRNQFRKLKRNLLLYTVLQVLNNFRCSYQNYIDESMSI